MSSDTLAPLATTRPARFALDQRYCAILRRSARVASSAVTLVGAVVLAGWSTGSHTILGLVPGGTAMKANTAAALLLAGIAALLLDEEPANRRGWRQRTASAMAATVLLIGAVSLTEDVLGLNVHADQLLIADRVLLDPTTASTRMAPNTAVALILAAIALMLLHARRGAWWSAHACAVLVGMLGAWGVIGYTLDVPSLYVVGSFTALAAPTAVCLMLLSIGVVLAQPTRGPVRLLATASPGGSIARRVVPLTLALPPLLGLLRWQGQLRGFYDTQDGILLLVITVSSMFTAMIWLFAWSLDRTEQARRRAEQKTAAVTARADAEQRRAAEQLDHLFELSSDLLAITRVDHTAVRLNPAWERTLGYSRDELMSVPLITLVHPDDVEDNLRAAAELSSWTEETASSSGILNRMRCKDGSYRWLMWSGTAVRSEGLVYTVARDVTEERVADEAKLDSPPSSSPRSTPSSARTSTASSPTGIPPPSASTATRRPRSSASPSPN